ncbi:3-keto-disaccharide hydrolase [Anatilimnocola floriformis]|uniref:3-keto-disaccharide hydrolase n=1 Tax=Anatilimnocola floriformis TaxID=2948575 RepID=UPI0020C5ABD9|nr:DUF1080 domain-containing protein [Anatilimnocola floriformis]
MRTFCLAIVGLILSSYVLQAEEKSEWVQMFDGKTLNGWKVNENEKSFSVADGAIVSHGDRSHLFYVGDEKPFKNFEFKAEVQTKENSNAGIFIHTKFQEKDWPKIGYECQVNNSYNKDPQKTGGLYNTVKVLEAPAKDNVWFVYYIKVEGKHVTIKIDDKTVVDFEEPADKPGTVKLSEGTFALQAHDPGSTVMFRNLQVKRLP